MHSFSLENADIQARLIAKNALAFSFLTYIPIVPGHALICPIRVVETCEQLIPEEWQSMLALRQVVCHALEKTFQVEGFNFAWNQGKVAGQTVPHFHLHVVPRKAGDTGIWNYEPRSFLYRPGSREISPIAELRATAELIRSNL